MSGGVQYTHTDDDYLATGTHKSTSAVPYLLYMLDETSGSTVTDSGFGDNDGTAVNSPTWGSGITLDGTDQYVDIGNPLVDIIKDSFSVSMWLTPSDGQPAATENLFGNEDGGNDEFYIQLTTAGKIKITFAANGTGISYTSDEVFSNGTQSSSTHVVVTVDKNVSISVYKNGSLLGTPQSLAVWYGYQDLYSQNTNNLHIGNYNGGSNYFTGKVDDVAIYNKCLSATEVSNLYNGENALNDTDVRLKSLGVAVGVYCENVTQSTGGAITAVTDTSITATGVTWRHGDTYKTYLTATKNSTIATTWTDRSRGWKADPKELKDGWFPEDVDLDDHGKHKVFGPGQPGSN